MLITEKEIKNIIREEVVKVLKEKSNLLPIYENKQKFLAAFQKLYPQSKNPGKLKSALETLAQQAKGEIALEYLSKQRTESLIRLVRSFSKNKNQSREQILQNYEFLQKEIFDIIEKVPIFFLPAAEHDFDQRLYNHFLSGGKKNAVIGVFDRKPLSGSKYGEIVINPYHSSVNSTFEINLPELERIIKEEIYHAIDINLAGKTPKKMKMIQLSPMLKKKATERGIFVSLKKSRLDPESYKYLTTDTEFYAKMLLLKDLVAKKFPKKIDATGKIDNLFLRRLIKAARAKSFFNLLAKRTNKTSQRMA